MMVKRHLRSQTVFNIALSLLFICAATLTEAFAQQTGGNQLDQSFGQAGRVATQFNPASPIGQNNIARTALIQPDGKILAVGVGTFDGGATYGPALVRYLSNGQLDQTFGNQGRALIFPSYPASDGLNAALLPDGRIIVVGVASNPNTFTSAWLVARLTPNGQVDTTFGANGRAVIDPSSGSDSALAVRVEADGKLLVAGSVGDAERSFALARLNADGSPDISFAPAGSVLSPFFGTAGAVTQALFLPDGRVVAAGPVTSVSTRDDIGLARYNADGSPDSTFTKSTTDFVAGAQDVTGKLASAPDGRIVLSGWVTYHADGTTTSTGSDMVIVRYNADGTLDQTFDGDGKVVTDIIGGMDYARAVVIQSDGKIVAVGDSATPTGGNPELTLVRYNADGSRDSAFGSNGVVRTSFSDVTYPAALGSGGFGAVIQPDGQIVATGTVIVEARRRHDFALARYRADSTTTPPPNCAAALSPSSAYFTSAAGAASFQIIIPAGCGWQAQSQSNWLTLTQANAGDGSAVINYAVAANSSTSTRTGTITAGGATFTVTQAGAPGCTFKLSTNYAAYKNTGGKGKVTVTASGSSCQWTAQSNNAWLTVTSGSTGRGNGAVEYAVGKNQSGVARTGTLTVAGQTVTIQQSGGK
ncbi:MAG TPA: BACON domain-containing carbohydrate-binding protein [Pyrinomonadaceae bacterium]|nr:BACON domain-containing carbohydrate-binding protein [Pyrinomonadaceae bacterium]